MKHVLLALLFCLPPLAAAQDEIRLEPEKKTASGGLANPYSGLGKGDIRIEGNLLKPVPESARITPGVAQKPRGASGIESARTSSAYSDPQARKSWSFSLPAISGGFDSFNEVRSWTRPVKEGTSARSVVYSAPPVAEEKKPGEKIEPAAAGFNTRFQWLDRDRRYFLLEYTVTPDK